MFPMSCLKQNIFVGVQFRRTDFIQVWNVQAYNSQAISIFQSMQMNPWKTNENSVFNTLLPYTILVRIKQEMQINKISYTR